MSTISLIFLVLLEIFVIRLDCASIPDTEVIPSTLDCPGVGFEWDNPHSSNPNLIDIFYDVLSWGDCAKLCESDSNCATWIYWWSPEAKWSLQCRTWTHDYKQFVKIVVHRYNNTLMGTQGCQAVHSCSSQDDFENGQVDGDITFGETITYSCDTNFRLIGQATRTCGLDGWSGTKPVCEESYCEVTYIIHDGNVLDTWSCSDGTDNCKLSGYSHRVKVGTSIETFCYEGGAKPVYMANEENKINRCEDHLTWQHDHKPYCYEYCAKLWESNHDNADIWEIKEIFYTNLQDSDDKDLNGREIDNDDIEQYQLWTGCNLEFWKDQSWKSHDADEIKYMKSSEVGTSKQWVPSGWGGKITAVRCYCD